MIQEDLFGPYDDLVAPSYKTGNGKIVIEPRRMTEPRAHRGLETSIAAAKSMRKCSAPMQLRIARFIGTRPMGGATYDDIVVMLRMEKPTVAGRLNDLSNAGFIESWTKAKTRSGRLAKVYFLTAAGKRLVAGS